MFKYGLQTGTEALSRAYTRRNKNCCNIFDIGIVDILRYREYCETQGDTTKDAGWTSNDRRRDVTTSKGYGAELK